MEFNHIKYIMEKNKRIIVIYTTIHSNIFKSPSMLAKNSYYKMIFIFMMLFTHCMYGQDSNIGQFAIWKAKDGQTQNFENGYKKHLNWHKTNGDQWGWYGWFFISGPRYGQFVDATFNHQWADFDKAVKPADDMADNRINVFPFGDVQSIFKAVEVEKASSRGANLKTKFIKMITLNVGDVEQAVAISEKLKEYYISKSIKFYKTYTMIDGGETKQLILMLGFDSWADYSLSEDFNRQISKYQHELKIETIRTIVSETMVYRADLSYFPN